MDNLKQLVKLQEELKAKKIDRKLTQLNFYDRTSKFFSTDYKYNRERNKRYQ